MPTIDDQIRATIDSFASDLSALVRRAALSAVTTALEVAPAAVPVSPAAKRGRGRPKKAAAPVKAAKPAPAAKASVSKRTASPKRTPGEKRPKAELAKLVDKLADYIKSHPGQRMEAIGKAIGTPTKALTLPVKKLLGAKKIRTQGEKRATEYFPT